MLKAALFDLDGTLVDDVPAHLDAWEAAFQGNGYRVPRAKIHALIGKTGNAIVCELVPGVEAEILQKLLDAHRRHFKARIPELLPCDGAEALLLALQARGTRVALVTSARKANAEPISSKFSFQFDAIVTAEDISNGKPHPEPFLRALQKLEVEASEAMAIGDSPYDAESAVAGGIRFLGVLTGGFSPETLLNAGAWKVYASPAAILADLDSLFGELNDKMAL